MPRGRVNTSGHVGVSMHKPSGLWRSYVVSGGKQITIAYRKEKADAARARADFIANAVAA